MLTKKQPPKMIFGKKGPIKSEGYMKTKSGTIPKKKIPNKPWLPPKLPKSSKYIGYYD